MTRWFTADPHFGHANIIGYCNRPFADVDVMNDSLIANWNETVAPDDTVWVLGDFALGQITDTLPSTSELNGHKILVAGNHDRCWAGHGPKAQGWTDRYLEAGFDEVVQESVTITVGGQPVLVSHFPYEGDSQDRDRYVEHRPVDEGGWLLHGHVHGAWAERARMINVGVDARNYRPMSESEVEALLV